MPEVNWGMKYDFVLCPSTLHTCVHVYVRGMYVGVRACMCTHVCVSVCVFEIGSHVARASLISLCSQEWPVSSASTFQVLGTQACVTMRHYSVLGSGWQLEHGTVLVSILSLCRWLIDKLVKHKKQPLPVVAGQSPQEMRIVQPSSCPQTTCFSRVLISCSKSFLKLLLPK